MSNFYQRQAARESVGEGDNNIDSLSAIAPVEENLDQQLADLASEDQGLDALAQDGEVLSDDIARTESAVDTATEAVEQGEEVSEEAVDKAEVAQESVRRRWGIMNERVATESFRRSRGLAKAAQESWRDTLKQLYQRFVEFLKTVKNKIKDLRLKYFNVGKTAQKRAKAYNERIRKLGKKKSDNISGSFITKLSLNGAFNVDESVSIAQAVTAGGKTKGVMDKVKALAEAAVTAMVKDGDEFKFQVAGAAVDLFGSASTKLRALPQFEDAGDAGKVYALPGNAYIQAATKKLSTKDGEKDYFAVGFTSTGDSTTDKQIDTPAITALSKAANAMEKLGKDYEKLLQDFRTYESELDKLETQAEKIAAQFDKSTEDAERAGLSNARTIADQAVRNYQNVFRAANYVARGVIDGLNGYVGAGIGAYESSKS